MMQISVEGLSLEMQGRRILDNIHLQLDARHTVGLIGPNGSGKSTLLRCLSGLYPAQRQKVRLNAIPLARIARRTLARKLAFVPQHAEADADMRVEQIVRLGRSPHRGAFTCWNAHDKQAVDEAIHLTALQPLLGRCWRQLSGGEKQRCQIARALAQQPEILLLDEPTNHLDVHHQLELMSLVSALPVTAVIALHDLNLAAHYCDRLVALRSGQVVGEGTPEQVLTPTAIESTWQVQARVQPGESGKVDVRFVYHRHGGL